MVLQKFAASEATTDNTQNRERKTEELRWEKERGAVQRRVQARLGGFAADAERITHEKSSSEDRKHTSGGVFVAIDNLGAVRIPGNAGRIAPAWVSVR